ncbi:MAG: DUF445 family protein [Clostridiales Family XIII bacterium]|nr:DUF445 family protein [Clostridiales Family XIII bacterium]
MISIIHLLSGPVIGAVIGYITNYIAVKMLFHPLKPIYIGKFKLPFTPGIVPRRKDDLANILGNAIYAKFFNADDLEIVFTSEYLKDAFAENIVRALESNRDTIRQTLRAFPDQPYIALKIDAIKEELCVRILAGVLKADLPRIIAQEGARLKESRSHGSIADRIGGEMLQAATDSLAGSLTGNIESYVLQNGQDIIMPLLDEEFEAFMSKPIADLTGGAAEDQRVLKNLIGTLYARFMRIYVRPIVETIDVGGMITKKVSEMDAGEIEILVLDVVKKELGYIVWLGALLGFIIGTLNIFI